ncbi:MAG: hypothetical protein WAW52_01335 [Methanothrix sp.]
MKFNKRCLIVYIITLITLVQGAYGGVQVTASGGVSDESGSVAMNFDALKTTSVSSQIAINGATITPSTTITGSVLKFEETHAVTDASGKSASVYVKVVNAPDGLTYSSEVLPGEGNVGIQPQVSAEQWLTVPKAESVKVTSSSSYGKMSANVGFEEYKGTASGDYVTLTGYNGKAVTTETSVDASQTADFGEAKSIKVYCSAKDTSGTYSIDTPINGISSGKATIEGMSVTASSGITTQTSQDEHVHGAFTSTAVFKPVTGKAKTSIRTSNYGTEYDLNMDAVKGSLPTGYLGYYVKPGMKIQDAVNAASARDTVNVAAGIYKENVKIYKYLTVKGAGAGKTIVDGNGAGSVFTLGRTCVDNRARIITLEDMTIRNGKAVSGGGIANVGCPLTLNDVIISGNKASYAGGAICSTGSVIMDGGSITGNTAKIGGGIYSWGTVVINDVSITGNTATGYGGGIYSSNSKVTLSGAGTVIKDNKGALPKPSQVRWYKGQNIYVASGIPTISNGFDPAIQVTGNT